MVSRVLIIAIIAGLIAGISVTGVQLLHVVPLINKAETYESALLADAHAHKDTSQISRTHDHADWAPEDGLERTSFTLLANVLTAVGFGLLLNAALAIYGRPTSLKQGIFWGAAGFAIFALAPAVGLPPELPGMHAAGLFERQTWYFGTIFSTGGGLVMAVFLTHWTLRALGAILILAPHAVGAPHPVEMGGNTPPELAAMFVMASLLTAAVLWVVLGGVSGYLHKRFAESG